MKKTITFTVGDNVWLMHGNHAVCATVVKVSYKKFICSANYESVIEHEVYTLCQRQTAARVAWERRTIPHEVRFKKLFIIIVFFYYLYTNL